MISFYRSGYSVKDLKTLLEIINDAQKKVEKDCKNHCFYCENEMVCKDLYKFSEFLKKLIREDRCSGFTES